MNWNDMGQWLLRGLFLALVGMIVAWQLQQLAAAPVRHVPVRITLAVPAGESRTVGATELAARQAEQDHLRVRHGRDGRWWLANASEKRAVLINRNGEEMLLRSVELAAATRFAIGGHVFQVQEVGDRRLRLLGPDGAQWLLDGGQLSKAGVVAPSSCEAGWIAQKLASAKAAFAPARIEIGGSFDCGNRIALQGVAVGVARIVRSAPYRYVLTPAADSARLVCVEVDQHGACAAGKLAQHLETPLDGVTGLVLGRTHYDVAAADDALRLTPRRRVALFDVPAVQDGVAWQFEPVDPWRWPWTAPPLHVLAAAFAILVVMVAWLCAPVRSVAFAGALRWTGLLAVGAALMAVCVAAWHHGLALAPLRVAAQQWWSGVSWPVLAAVPSALLLLAVLRRFRPYQVPLAAAALLAAGTVALLLVVFANAQATTLGAGWSIVLQACALAAIALLPQHSLLAWSTFALVALMFAVGGATQLALGLTGTDTGGVRYFQSGAVAVAAAVFMWLAVAGLLRARLMMSATVTALSLVQAIVLPLLAVGALVAQAFVGGEAGLGSFQPVEAAKLALVLFSAVVLTNLLQWNDSTGRARSWLIATFGLLITLLLAVLVLLLFAVRDMSPFVLMGIWVGGMLLVWAVASGHMLGALLSLCWFATAGLFVTFLRSDCPLMALAVPSAALLAYLALRAAHQAWRKRAAAGWLLAGTWLVLGAAGVAKLSVMDTDAVRIELSKYERIASWLAPAAHPHTGAQARIGADMVDSGGIDGGLEMRPFRLPEVQNDMAPSFLLSRFGAIGGCILVGLQALYLACLLSAALRFLHDAGPRQFQRRWLETVGYFALTGFALFLTGHWLISWGANTGLLPIMGQPMPFISIAGSLTLIFIAPLQGLFFSSPTQGMDAVNGNSSAHP